LLATHLDDSIRDGKAAVASAEAAIKLTKDAGGEEWEALAAAYAEAGEFEKAVTWQQKAMGDKRYVKEFGDVVRTRLDGYQKGKAYRE
jgi:tetratricopeptide (TPR) repeat protein